MGRRDSLSQLILSCRRVPVKPGSTVAAYAFCFCDEVSIISREKNQDGRLFEVGANSRLSACSDKYGGLFTISTWVKFLTGKVSPGIAFTICTNQFHLPRKRPERLKLVSRMALKKCNPNFRLEYSISKSVVGRKAKKPSSQDRKVSWVVSNPSFAGKQSLH